MVPGRHMCRRIVYLARSYIAQQSVPIKLFVLAHCSIASQSPKARCQRTRKEYEYIAKNKQNAQTRINKTQNKRQRQERPGEHTGQYLKKTIPSGAIFLERDF